MRMPLSQQAEEIVGKSELVIITERVDDVALLIGQMVTMGLPEVLDRHIPRHWKQRGLSWGWTAVIWLAYIVTEGDHRKVSVETYITGMKHTLSQLSNQVIEPVDFSDDRLGHLLQHLSKPTYWHKIERDLNARSIEVYALSQEVIRCDATTVSGERADDGLYIPIIARIRTGLNTSGLLFVGDGKMSAFETRTHVAGHHDFSLSPLPFTGATAEAMDAWIAEGGGERRGR